MRKHIIALMNEGIPLEEIHVEVEKIFNEEYKKREAEQERIKRFAAVNAALDRASTAIVDFMNNYVGEEVITVEECREALKETAIRVKMAVDMEKAVTQPADDDVDEQKLMDFLTSMGLIKLK